ncbi:MAG TPA: response regulator [Bacillota bacterium]|nr:response regulator [Bacillota bacterium]
MLKVLIVDDDVFFHTYLKQLIDWEREGFEICGVATNGSEAIELIKSERPEIVITDMSMPGIDGVAVIKFLQSAYPRAKAIALSAYHDFDYVRQSLKTGAVDYILKHTLTAEVLINTLSTVKQGFLQEERNDEEQRRIDEQLQTGKFFFYSKVLLICSLKRESSANRKRNARLEVWV